MIEEEKPKLNTQIVANGKAALLTIYQNLLWLKICFNTVYFIVPIPNPFGFTKLLEHDILSKNIQTFIQNFSFLETLSGSFLTISNVSYKLFL